MLRTLGCAVLLGAIALPAWSSPSAGTGRLEGVVTGQRYGLAIPAVSVTLRAETFPLVQVRQTERDGTFAFDDLPAGLYSLEAVGHGEQRTTVSPVLVVPGIAVTEHLVVAETPRPYVPPPRS